MELWNVDLHNHTLWSKDCIMKFEAIIRLCERRGIHRIAITDHNTAEGALAMKKIAPDLVIVGEEIMTTQGELLAYFVSETVPAGLTPNETIQHLRDQGAVISVSHPFDRLRRGAWDEKDLLEIIEYVDAIEIFNARCLYPEDNDKARDFAQKHGVLGTIGSDSHIGDEYGTSMARMKPFSGPVEFLESLRQAEYMERLSPAYVHVGSKIAKWSKKLRLKRRMWEGG